MQEYEEKYTELMINMLKLLEANYELLDIGAIKSKLGDYDFDIETFKSQCEVLYKNRLIDRQIDIIGQQFNIYITPQGRQFLKTII